MGDSISKWVLWEYGVSVRCILRTFLSLLRYSSSPFGMYNHGSLSAPPKSSRQSLIYLRVDIDLKVTLSNSTLSSVSTNKVEKCCVCLMVWNTWIEIIKLISIYSSSSPSSSSSLSGPLSSISLAVSVALGLGWAFQSALVLASLNSSFGSITVIYPTLNASLFHSLLLFFFSLLMPSQIFSKWLCALTSPPSPAS